MYRRKRKQRMISSPSSPSKPYAKTLTERSTMKTSYFTFLLFALGSCVLFAQEQTTPGPVISAIAQPRTAKGNAVGKLQLVPPPQGIKNMVSYLNRDTREVTTVALRDLKALLIETPKDLAEALRAYKRGDLNEARRPLASARSKYSGFADLPHNPAVRAVLTELVCDARLMDWTSLKKAVGAATSMRGGMEASDRAMVDAARLLCQVSDDPETASERLKAVETLLADSGKLAHMRTEPYSWLKYAQGRALASQLSEAELRDGVPSEKEKQASLAVDAFCEAAAAAHSRHMELSKDAMLRAFRILWAMPGVQQYANEGTQMTKKGWAKAPYNFRDAVALAFMLKNIYFNVGESDSLVDKAAGFFYNTMADKQKTEGAVPADKASGKSATTSASKSATPAAKADARKK